MNSPQKSFTVSVGFKNRFLLNSPAALVAKYLAIRGEERSDED